MLNDDTKLDMIEFCCKAFTWFEDPPWYSSGDESEQGIFDLCIKITGNIMENTPDLTALLETGMNRI
jgi:hypothetical protein